MSKQQIIKNARAAKASMMDNLIALAIIDGEETGIYEKAKKSFDAMSDGDFMAAHGVRGWK